MAIMLRGAVIAMAVLALWAVAAARAPILVPIPLARGPEKYARSTRPG